MPSNVSFRKSKSVAIKWPPLSVMKTVVCCYSMRSFVVSISEILLSLHPRPIHLKFYTLLDIPPRCFSLAIAHIIEHHPVIARIKDAGCFISKKATICIAPKNAHANDCQPISKIYLKIFSFDFLLILCKKPPNYSCAKWQVVN